MRLAALLMLLALPAAAGPRTVTPQGWALEARNLLERRDPPAMFPSSWAQIVRRVNDTSVALCWVGFVLQHEGPLVWPKWQRVYLVLRDSSQVRDSLALVCEPKESFTMKPYPPLGFSTLTVEPDHLWREPCPWGGMCTRVLIGFPRSELPRGFTLKDAADVRVGALGPSTIRTRKGGSR